MDSLPLQQICRPRSHWDGIQDTRASRYYTICSVAACCSFYWPRSVLALCCLVWRFLSFGWLNNDDVYRWCLLNIIQLFDFVFAYFIQFCRRYKTKLLCNVIVFFFSFFSMIPKDPDSGLCCMIHMHWLSACICMYIWILDTWYSEFTFTVFHCTQFSRLDNSNKIQFWLLNSNAFSSAIVFSFLLGNSLNECIKPCF